MVSGPSLLQAIPSGERVLLDSTTILAYFNGNERVSPLASQVIDDCVRSGRNQAIVSMITVMEVLVRPLRQGTGVYRHAMDFLRSFPNLHATEIDLVVAQEAASLRATYNFAPPDALVIATGIASQVGFLVTNDAAWKSKLTAISRRIQVCYLTDHV